jgi:hypothetical protein
MLIKMGDDLSATFGTEPRIAASATLVARPVSEPAPTKPHIALTGAWFHTGFDVAALKIETRPTAIDQPTALPVIWSDDFDWSDDDVERYEPPLPASDQIDATPIDNSEIFDAVSNLGCF